MIGYEIYLTNLVLGRILITVIKPGPAWRVEPRPGRPGGWTGSGLLKDRLMQQPGKTRQNPAKPGGSTHDPGDPDKTRCLFFPFQMSFLCRLGKKKVLAKRPGDD
jgi:hypothetical protein